MEGRVIKISNCSANFTLPEYLTLKISKNLKYLYTLTKSGNLSIYSIAKSTGISEYALWKSDNVHCCIFSENNNEFLVVSDKRSFKYFKIEGTEVLLVQEKTLQEMSETFRKYFIDFTGTSEVTLLKLSQSAIILFLNKLWLVTLKWTIEEIFVHYKIAVSSCVTIVVGRNALYTLTVGGNVSQYDMQDGQQVGVIHLYGLVPPERAMDVLSFKHMVVSLDNNLLAVADLASEVFVVQMKCNLSMPESREQQRWDCGTSVRSFGSDVSGVTNVSQLQPKILSDSTSLSPSVIQEPEPSSTPSRMSWNSYVHSLSGKASSPSEGFLLGTQSFCMQRLPTPPPGLTVRALHLGPGELSVWYTEPGAKAGGVYRLYNLVSGAHAEEQLPEDTVVIPGGLLGLRDAFLSPRGLWMFFGEISQDTLVSKLLHCMQTESVRHLLQGDTWDNLMVPLPAVAAALKQHNLDVAHLALNLHVHGLESNISSTNCDDKNQKEKLEKLISDFDVLLEVICQAAEDFVNKPILQEQLNFSTLEHTNRLLEFLSHSQHPAAKEVTHVVMKKVVKIRKNLSNQPTPLPQIKKDSLEYPENFSSKWQQWLNFSDEEVIQDSVLNNFMPLAQIFLLKVRSWPHKDFHAKLNEYITKWINDLLEKSLVSTAEEVLWRVGKDPEKELLHLCVNSWEIKRRDLLFLYLNERDSFPPKEKDMLNFLRKVEEILSVIDLTKLKNREITADSEINITFKMDSYSIASVLEKSDNWRQKVLISLFFNIPGARHVREEFRPEMVWEFLLEHNRQDLLSAWIACRCSETREVPPGVHTWVSRLKAVPLVPAASDCSIISAEELMEAFLQWPITQCMIDSVHNTHAMSVTKEKVLCHLSQYAIFSNTEKSDATKMIKRLILAGNMENAEAVLSQSSGNVSFQDLKMMLTRLIVDNDLHYIAFPCLENFDYSQEQVQSLKDSNGDKGWDWFSLWLVFREMQKDPQDQQAVYKCILKSAQYLSEGDLSEYLKKHPLVVMALLVYSGVPLMEIFASGGVPDVDADVLSATLQHYPLLARALERMENPHKEKPDITVYQLLEGNAPVDTSKLFGWQEDHKIEGEELPNFSSPKLVEKYGVEYKMNYLIYLKLGRPCFAACKFIIDQFKEHATLSQKRINYACKLAHQLALENFRDTEISVSCLAFTEIMGKDSLHLKVDIATARKVLAYLQFKKDQEEYCISDPSKIVGDLLSGLSRREAPTSAELLRLLQEALQWEMKEDSSSVRALQEWSLSVKFARAHNLELPELFMKQLTSQNNWLHFMLFAEMQKYPLAQVKELAKSFESEILQEHLFHILQIEVPEVKREASDSTTDDGRKTSVSKSLSKKSASKQENAPSGVGRQRKSPKQPKKEDVHQAEITQQLMELIESVMKGEIVSTSGSSLATFEVWKGNPLKDLLLVLLQCHDTLSPSKALLDACFRLRHPVYAVLALSYNHGLVVAAFCTWLLVSLPQQTFEQLSIDFHRAIKEQLWTEEDVIRLLEETVTCQYIRTLQFGCSVFLHESPLGNLMDFLFEAVVRKDFKESVMKMKLFTAAFLNWKSSEPSEEEHCFYNIDWLGSASVQLVKQTLFKAFANLHFELQFIAVLLEGRLMEHLPGDLVPDLVLVERLAKCFPLTGVYPDLEALSAPVESSVYQQEVERCLQELLQKKEYQAALQLTSVVGLNKDSVLLAQWHNKFEQSRSNTRPLARDDLYFWKKCNEAFRKEKIHRHSAATFFRELGHQVDLVSERYHVFQLAAHWLRLALEEADAEEAEEVERELAAVEVLMWNCWIESKVDLPLFLDHSEPELLYVTKDVILQQASLSHVISLEELSEEKNKKAHSLIGKLLDAGGLVPACRVEAIYSLKNQDLRILLLCLDLAEGEVSPYELTSDQRMLFSDSQSTRKISHQQKLLFSSISSVSHSPSTNELLVDYVEIPPRDRQDTLNALEKLTGKLKHGLSTGNRIIMCYRIAMNLNMSYQDVLGLKDSLILLKTALADDCLNKFIVASDLISAGDIKGEEVADFLAEEILTAIKRSKLKREVSGTPMWGVDLDSSFHLVLDVSRDQAALGRKLMSVALEITSSSVQSFYEGHVIAVELLIYAQNAFAAALDMEGIGLVLKMCHTITNRLATRQEWALMVRLFTGIGRYTEMRYIFKILYENDQFEFLLAKGLDRVKGLQQAVVDFLRMYCTNDRRLQEMVALRFSMFEEVAAFWENDGWKHEKALIKLIRGTLERPSTLPITEAVQDHLFLAIDCFKHSSEFFFKGEKLLKAARLARHSELLALQIYFVNAGAGGQNVPLLLQRNPQEVKQLITHDLNFPQACIVAEAYDHLVDWGAALYHHCVLNGDEVYFAQFTSNLQLTTSIIEDVVRRFQANRQVTSENVQMMKRFVQQVSAMDVKYRLASLLGFRDIAEGMISMPDVAHLKDTVFQHGFRR